MEIKFKDNKYIALYQAHLAKMKCRDCYHQAVAYLFSLDVVCCEHVNDLFDFKHDVIKPAALDRAWQTGTSKKTTRLAFNLWNGHCSDGETYTQNGYETDLLSSYYTMDNIFCCSYAPLYYEAIKLRYPEYT